MNLSPADYLVIVGALYTAEEKYKLCAKECSGSTLMLAFNRQASEARALAERIEQES